MKRKRVEYNGKRYKVEKRPHLTKCENCCEEANCDEILELAYGKEHLPCGEENYEITLFEETPIETTVVSCGNDAINPSHYGSGNKIECIDAMEEAMGLEGVQDFCKGNAIKYLWRIGKKDDSLQEMEKVRWYINKWIELEEKKRSGENASD